MHVANQIRWAQQKAALVGQAPPAWAIGAACQAPHPSGQMQEAEVTGVTATGSFVVKFSDIELEEEVHCPCLAGLCELVCLPRHECALQCAAACFIQPTDVQRARGSGMITCAGLQFTVEQIKPPPEQQEVYQGVTAPKRKRVDAATDVGEMPKVWPLLRGGVLAACLHACPAGLLHHRGARSTAMQDVRAIHRSWKQA